MALRVLGPPMTIPASQYFGQWRSAPGMAGDISDGFAAEMLGLVKETGNTLQASEAQQVVRLVQTLLNGSLIQRGTAAAVADVAGGAICYLRRMQELDVELGAHNIYQAIFGSLYLAEKTLYREPSSSIEAWQQAVERAQAMPAPILQAVGDCVPLTVQWLNGNTQLDAQMTLMGSLLLDSFSLDGPGSTSMAGLEASQPVERVATIQPQLSSAGPRVLAEGAVGLPLRIGPTGASGGRALDGRITAQPRLPAAIPQRVPAAPPGFAEASGRERKGASASGSGEVASQHLPGQVSSIDSGTAPTKPLKRIPGYGHSPSMTVIHASVPTLGKRAQQSAPPLRQPNRPGAVGSAEAPQRVFTSVAGRARTSSISVNRGSIVTPASQAGLAVQPPAVQPPAAAAVRVQAPGAVSRFLTAIQARWTRWRNS